MGVCILNMAVNVGLIKNMIYSEELREPSGYLGGRVFQVVTIAFTKASIGWNMSTVAYK